jgi:hypothetical protein
MPHGHGGAGENPEEIGAFANNLLKNDKPLAKIIDQGVEGKTLWATFNSSVPIASAELLFTKDQGEWFNREWYSEPANLSQNKVNADLPEGATVCYLNLIDEKELVVSTEHFEF